MNVRKHLSALIGLALVDHDFSDNEKHLILSIGKAHKISEREIEELILRPEKVDMDSLNDDQKFELLYDLVLLMKVDREVYYSEINYCQEIATRLGFDKAVIAELSSKIYSDPAITSDKAQLRQKVLAFKKA
ncbi:MAG: TerB family tellurite resistance protein [Imperialibacter sp.]|uniref:TerB family tellurite resistance protein n=1 Tax=Imperialibacter sp. TaxID=2038411 RepID=UPI0032EEABD9